MNVDFPSRPVLRKGRLLLVSEYPSYECLTTGVPHPFFGVTYDVLERCCFYLKISPEDFSYTPIIRCWRNVEHVVTQKEYTICRDYIKQFATLSEAPAIVMLGSMVIKYSLPDSVAFKDGKYAGNDRLRKSWKEVPPMTLYGVPGVPSEHPASVKLVRCNSQITFRSLCVDLIRAIEYAATKSDAYARIAAGIDRTEYITDYRKLLREVELRGKSG